MCVCVCVCGPFVRSLVARAAPVDAERARARVERTVEFSAFVGDSRSIRGSVVVERDSIRFGSIRFIRSIDE